MRVLYVEDMAADADLAQRALRRSAPDIEIEIARTFAEATERLFSPASPPFDLVLTDLNLPDGSGLGLLAAVRTRGLPLAVVMLTGSSDEKVVFTALKAGADDYVAKRGDYLSVLPLTLRAALERYRAAAGRRTRGVRVLYAETNERAASQTQGELVREAPYVHLDVVSTADEVLARLPAAGRASEFDVLLLDYRLPGMSGTELIKEIREVRRLDLPIILVTDDSDEEIARQALRLGAADYVVKSPGYLRHLPWVIENTWLRACSVRNEKALAAERGRLAGIIGSALDAILTFDAEDRIVLFNSAAEPMFGLTSQEAIGQSIERFLPGSWVSPVVETASSAAHGDGPNPANRKIIETIAVRATGEKFPIEASLSEINVDGARLRSVIVRDISERREAELALRRSEERFRDLAANIKEVMWISSPDRTRLEYVSPSFVELFGRPLEYATRSYAERMESVHPDDRVKMAESIAKSSRGEPYDLEYRTLRPDGTVRWVRSRAFPVLDELGNVHHVVGVADDITDRKVAADELRRSEERFRQAQKMEAIGLLSAGVAHDFNNILTVIQMNLSLLQTGVALSTRQRTAADEIGKAGDRAANLTRQLLMFSRRQTMQPRDLDLSEVIAHMSRMLNRILGEDVHVQLHFGSKPVRVHADAGMMEQILLNLVVNSRDAMPTGGRLVVETSEVDFDEVLAAKSAQARPGAFVCLAVSDTGGGIPDDVLPHIFEPFFTTKDVGNGTGLGLATVYGIVQQHQGWINVYSELGQGTTFRVYLPRLQRALAPSPAPGVAGPARGGKETILVVEDEPALRMVVKMSLAHFGYRILEAATGRAALELWKDHKDEIRLLLTDLVMPDGMNGRQLAEILLAERPELKVVYTSGYSVEFAGHQLKLEAGVNFLSKPYDAPKLAELIRSKLDE